MGRNHARTGALVALASLAVAAGASAQAPAAAPQAQTDVLSDVTIRAYPSGDPTNVMANRLSRFVSSNCFSADVFTPDPTERFNRAYYAEMTGDAEHYAAIRPTAPKKKPRHRYPPALHPGERIFASLSGPMAVPGTGRAPIAPGGNGRSVTNPCLAAATRTRADKNTTFARALAHYDLGEYDEALPLFKQARGELGGSISFQ